MRLIILKVLAGVSLMVKVLYYAIATSCVVLCLLDMGGGAEWQFELIGILLGLGVITHLDLIVVAIISGGKTKTM